MTSKIFLPAVALALMGTVNGAPGTPGSSLDPSSSSNLDSFAALHLEMDYTIDFDTQTTFGTVTHHLQALENGTETVFMDIWDAVEVSKAEFWTADGVVATERIAGFDGIPVDVEFEITTPNPNTGNALGITVPEMMAGTMFYIRLTYRSLPETTALAWMTPEQTAGKTKPFVYSLCQMNFCRDWAPMMDSPSQKITYNASITAPNDFVVSMSGNETGKTPFNETWTTTNFECALKIPSYQIALVVGDLKSVDLGGRVVVFAEEPYIDAAAKEFEDLPALLAETEAYLTPYIWGNYSIMVMPPSFPWGGMEHINANLVSHTLIAGDKSMLDTAIHEITHSWFGNDVGCLNWNHFWINEGVNVFMERKILGSYYGEEYAKIDYSTGNSSMYYGPMLDWYGLNDSYSSLFPDIGDDDPENSFSDVPYEKGSQFMYYIESIIGENAMQAMLRDYIVQFSQQAIDEDTFQVWYYAWVAENFPSNSTDIIDMTMWDVWVREPGLGPVTIDVATTALQEAEALAMEYLELNLTDSPELAMDYNGYYASQKVAFIQKLSSSGQANAELMEFIDTDLSIIESGNPKVKTEWYELGIKVGYDAVLEPTYVWLGEQGRSAYCRPLFTALIENGYCDLAVEWFSEYRSFYNSYVALRVESSLEACSESDVADDEETQEEIEDETTPESEEGEDDSGGEGSSNQTSTSNVVSQELGALVLLAFTLLLP